MGKRFQAPTLPSSRGGGINASGRSASATQAAKQQEHANHGKRKADQDYCDWHELLMVRLALRGAVGDQQNQPKEGGGQAADQGKRDPKEDSPDRFHGIATGSSLRGLDVDDEPRWISELEGANAG